MKYSALIIFLLTLSACITQQHHQHASLTGCKYDSSLLSTNFLKIGDYSFNVAIPGNWTYAGFDNNSRDHVFKDSLGQKLLIFNGSRGATSFNKMNLDGDEFINLFYKWDADWYVANNSGLTTTILEREQDKYLIATYSDTAITSTSLYGTKAGNGIRITIVSQAIKAPQVKLVSTIYHNLK